MYELSEEIKLDKNIKHNIDIVVDRLVVKDGIEQRLTDSIENVLELAEGLLVVDVIGGEPVTFSQSFSCPDCGISVEREWSPEAFPSTILSVPARYASAWDIRWNLTRI